MNILYLFIPIFVTFNSTRVVLFVLFFKYEVKGNFWIKTLKAIEDKSCNKEFTNIWRSKNEIREFNGVYTSQGSRNKKFKVISHNFTTDPLSSWLICCWLVKPGHALLLVVLDSKLKAYCISRWIRGFTIHFSLEIIKFF